jgi:hypothetical protein
LKLSINSYSNLDFLFVDWCAFFGVLLNPIENLLFRMLIKSWMLPSLSRRLQAMRECRVPSVECRTPIAHDLVDTRMPCPRQRIGRDRNIMFPFCDVINISNLLASEFDFLKGRVFAEDLAQNSCDREFSEAC